MNNTYKFDAVIIGAGASGLMCAIAAKKKNKNISVAIIEKNDRVGKKLLSTGNGRCNLTHRDISPDHYRGSFKEQSTYLFSKYDTNTLLEKFKKLGLLCFCDNEGRYYPLCRQASAMLDVLRFACERLGVNIFCGENIKSVKKAGKNFNVTTENTMFVADKIVIANGSKASPKLGGNASSADYLKNFGHRVIPYSPALCPIEVKSDILKSLKGIRTTANVSLIDANQRIIKSEIGEVQFGDKTLSGICIFNLSVYTEKGNCILLDLLYNVSYSELSELITTNQKLFSDFTVDNLFTGIFQKRLGQAVLKTCNISNFSRKCGELAKEELNNIANAAKNMRFPLIQNCGFELAQTALGGVVGREINEKTMESKIIKGLYVCGEAIDICGECGGYNLHFAFASGLNAGENL